MAGNVVFPPAANTPSKIFTIPSKKTINNTALNTNESSLFKYRMLPFILPSIKNSILLYRKRGIDMIKPNTMFKCMNLLTEDLTSVSFFNPIRFETTVAVPRFNASEQHEKSIIRLTVMLSIVARSFDVLPSKTNTADQRPRLNIRSKASGLPSFIHSINLLNSNCVFDVLYLSRLDFDRKAYTNIENPTQYAVTVAIAAPVTPYAGTISLNPNINTKSSITFKRFDTNTLVVMIPVFPRPIKNPDNALYAVGRNIKSVSIFWYPKPILLYCSGRKHIMSG